jgi:hypothetical protein
MQVIMSWTNSRFLLYVFLFARCFSGASYWPSLSAKPKVQITSPKDGALAHPGENILVTVSSSGATFAQMVVIGQDPIGFSQILTAPPYQFSIQIPSDIAPGIYTLTASGAISPGNGLDSDPISIDVERPDQPISIRTEPSTGLHLDIGERTGLRVIGKYNDCSTIDLTESTQTTYSSQIPM